ncbi:MAG: exopolysaccharide biosynthesis protein [Xanthomonadaceae bacterium]|nr:exopolysaccharide biosynthesis protein [Xanthomonadaceae bacterium]
MRSVLDAMAAGDPADTLAVRDVIQGLGRGTFGVLLFLAALPAFIPIPGLAGGLSGPLVVLVGLQVLILLPNPWLPGFIARRGPLRSTVIRFDRKVSPWLRRLEKMVRPRLLAVVEHPLSTVFTGLQLVLLGILLSLPIPFTNYLFAGLLLVYALALLERDGAMMLFAWACGVAAIGVFGVLSGNLVALAWAWLEKLP